MRRSSFAALSLTLVFAALAPLTAVAQEMALGEHLNGGLGFHRTAAPVGVRWWFPGQKIAIDAGIGFSSEPSLFYSDEKLTSWALDVGVPLVFRSWDRVHLIGRPGLLWRTQEVETDLPPDPFDTDNLTQFDLTAEIEVELFLAENVSVSAAHGLAFSTVDPPGGGDSQTSLNTIGNNFTTIGFHVYFFGGNR